MSKKNKDKEDKKTEIEKPPVTEKSVKDDEKPDIVEKAKEETPKKEPDHHACPLEVFCKLNFSFSSFDIHTFYCVLPLY